MLPMEVLRLIFECHEAISEHMEDPEATHPTLILSAVCAYWRVIVLDHPALWSRINFASSPNQPEYCSERAERHPLTLTFMPKEDDADRFRNDSVDSTPAHRFLSEKLPQTVDLTIDLASRLEIRDLVQTTSAPLLQRCAIHNTREVTVLAKPLFGNGAPQLRHLELYGVLVPRGTSCLQNLSVLIVDSLIPSYYTNFGATMRGLLTALPNIQHLDLRTLAPSEERLHVPDVPHDSTSRVVMCCLHTLKLQMFPQLMRYILSSVTLPSVHTFEMHLGTIEEDEGQLVSTLCHPDMLPPRVFSRVTRLNVEVAQLGEYRVFLEGFSKSDDAVRVFLLDWAWKSWRSMDLQILRQLASDIRQYHVSTLLHTLSVNSHRRLQDDIFFGELFQQPSLRCFVLKGLNIKTPLAELMSTMVARTTAGQPKDIELTLHGCALAADALDAFQRSSGHAIRSLHLCDVNFTVASKDAIESAFRSIWHVAKEVTWDLGDKGAYFRLDPDSDEDADDSRFWVKVIGNLDGGVAYMVQGLYNRYKHRFEVLW